MCFTFILNQAQKFLSPNFFPRGGGDKPSGIDNGLSQFFLLLCPYISGLLVQCTCPGYYSLIFLYDDFSSAVEV